VIQPDVGLLLENAYRYLSSSPVFQEQVELGNIGRDLENPEGWVWQGDPGTPPPVVVEGSGKSGIVLSLAGFWSSQNQHNTAQFPRLQLSIYMDCQRDPANGFPVADNASNRAYALYQKLNPLFHDAGNRIHVFDQMPVVSTTQGSAGLAVMDVPDGDNLVRGQVVYNIVL
jgi:hypothetical protein